MMFNRALRLLLLTNGLVLVAGAMMGPIYALFVQKIGGDLMDASLTGAIFALAAGITTLVAGRIADKRRSDELIVATGYFIMGIGFLMYMFASSVWEVFAIQIITGFAEAFYSPAFDALYSRHISRSRAGSEWGAWEALNYFSIALGAVMGGILASIWGFKSVFIIMSLLCFASSAYIFLFFPKSL